MSDLAVRFRNVAAAFTARVEGVPDGGWERPAPCEGWMARDIVRHLVEWVPPFLSHGAGVDVSVEGSADDDPVGAWASLRDQVQAILDDPDASARDFDNPNTGKQRVDNAIGTFVLGDVLVHTWDLARATGQDETLDPAEVKSMLAGVEPMGDAMAKSGHFGPRVHVADDADEQTRLIAFTGRQP